MPNLLTMLPQGPYAIYEGAANDILLALSSIDLHVHRAEFAERVAAGEIKPVGFAASIPVHGENGHGGKVTPTSDDGKPVRKSYPVSDGVGILSLHGPMQKEAAPSMDEGASTIALRRQVRQAKADPDVKAVALHIDSPGGTVAGTADLGADVADLAQIKPVYAFIEDMGASAAYWIASQCNAIYANPSAWVGSIGVRHAIFDTSEKASKAGVKAHWLVSGDHKAPGAPGSVVTPEQVAVMQDSINRYANQFVAAVNRGRKMNLKAGDEPADGRMYVGAQARNNGLVDGITTFDNVLSQLKSYKPAS